MSQQAAIGTLVEALTAVPAYDNPLLPIYEVFGREQPALSGSKWPLTLNAIRQHSQLLHDQSNLARDQSLAVHSVIQSCQRIPPVPLLHLPFGF
jgi:hypothetical protein